MRPQFSLTDGSATPWSRLYLPKLKVPPATIFAHLVAHFPHISPDTWRSRVARGLITLDDGTKVREDSPYRHGVTVFYRKEVLSEPSPIHDEVILYRNENILVADKPHGMVVTPVGGHVERSLLVRLQRSTGLDTLAPMHRLDRETAGVVLFAIDPACRGRYHQLFAQGIIEREYLAVAHVVDAPERKQWHVENRMEPGDPWFLQQIVDGPANAITEIEILERRGKAGLFRLRPASGRKHQIRVHMASIGFPIVGDPLYPAIVETQDGDPPLQLLANRLSFIDPLNGTPHSFVSARTLLRNAFADDLALGLIVSHGNTARVP